MTDLLGIDGKPIERNVSNIKNSIMGLESFMFVLQNVTVSGRFSKGFYEGFQFLQQMHDQLLAQLSPEEIEEFKLEANKSNKGPVN